MMSVRLDDHYDAILSVAARRGATNRTTGVSTRKVDHTRTDKAIDIEGAIGEAAVALMLGCFSQWLEQAVQHTPQSRQPDVEHVHVRACAHKRGLLLKPEDLAGGDLGAYCLVWVAGSEPATVCGWRFGFECCRDEFWRKDIPRPAYIVPSSRLYSTRSLINYNASFSRGKQ